MRLTSCFRTSMIWLHTLINCYYYSIIYMTWLPSQQHSPPVSVHILKSSALVERNYQLIKVLYFVHVILTNWNPDDGATEVLFLSLFNSKSWPQKKASKYILEANPSFQVQFLKRQENRVGHILARVATFNAGTLFYSTLSPCIASVIFKGMM